MLKRLVVLLNAIQHVVLDTAIQLVVCHYTQNDMSFLSPIKTASQRSHRHHWILLLFSQKRCPETAKELNNTIDWLIQQKEPKSHFSFVYLFRCFPVALDKTPQVENTQSIINLHRSHGRTWQSHGWRVWLYDDVNIHTVDANNRTTQCFSVFSELGARIRFAPTPSCRNQKTRGKKIGLEKGKESKKRTQN